jgi:uncharacterized protein YkwD
MKRRLALAAVLTAALVPTAATAEAQACAGADNHPSQVSVTQLRSTTTCLVNAERGKRGLAPLRANTGLRLAAQRHARDMVRKRYFSHASRKGVTFKTRILRAGYLRGSGNAILGENLAWGSGGSATPRSIVRSWMNSPGHRANILRGQYREIGIGIVRNAPTGAARGATYTAEFGRRF